MGKITVTKALCSLQGLSVCEYLAGCSSHFHFPQLPMWRECLAGKRESETGVVEPHKTYPRPNLDPPEQRREALTREDRMQRAIDVFSRLGFLEQCGLWLFSHIDPEDQNLVWTLIRTSSGGDARPGFHYRRAAEYRHPRRNRRNWKDSKQREKYHLQLDRTRADEAQQLKRLWRKWEPILSRALEKCVQEYPEIFDSYEKYQKIPRPPGSHQKPRHLRAVA